AARDAVAEASPPTAPATPAPAADPAQADAPASKAESVAASETTAAQAASAPPAGPLPVDPGVRPPRGGKTDLEWPAADLQQVRQPKDR
ncbi:MAG: hypothetical protein M3P84_11835, partial [Chloroflexota bacterium]|nr:hypothetical protein [Chloroflexota bacterium]